MTKSLITLLVAVSAFAAEPTSGGPTAPKAPPIPLKLAPPTAGWRYEEQRRFPAAEAGQGVAADRDFLYAINNHTIAKYRKEGGERIALWEGGNGGPIIHMNAGVVFEGKLYCAHSNYPTVPMLSSVEIFDTATLKHVGSHSFGRMDGSFTWLDRRNGKWIACFVHYAKRGGEPGRGPDCTQLIEFDDQWRRTGGWGFPTDFAEHIGPRGYSVSGGAFGPGGFLYATGHDHPELYVLSFPEAGSSLKWIATIPITTEGQAFGWDPGAPEILYTVGRRSREIIVGRVTAP
jgi:hypothetical protein